MSLDGRANAGGAATVRIISETTGEPCTGQEMSRFLRPYDIPHCVL